MIAIFSFVTEILLCIERVQTINFSLVHVSHVFNEHAWDIYGTSYGTSQPGVFFWKEQCPLLSEICSPSKILHSTVINTVSAVGRAFDYVLAIHYMYPPTSVDSTSVSVSLFIHGMECRSPTVLIRNKIYHNGRCVLHASYMHPSTCN